MKLEEVQARESKHILPVAARLPVALVSGRGSRVTDVEGREYVDLTSGWGVCAIGHCHPALVSAISDQAGRLMQTTNVFYTLPQLDLAEALAQVTPRRITRSFFVNSGTEAIEGSLKLAHRATGRRKFVSTFNSFHGRTLGALSVIGQAKHRDPYRALLPEAVNVPFGDPEAAARAIDRETAAFIVEPVQGEGGVNPAPPGYLARLRELCDASGALLIFDEVQTGIGRTGRMLALEHDGAVPDVLALGKGLGGGFPVAAFLCTEEVSATVKLGDHGGTYVGNPLACAAALATLRGREPRACQGGARPRSVARARASRSGARRHARKACPGCRRARQRDCGQRDATLPGPEHPGGGAERCRRQAAGAREELSGGGAWGRGRGEPSAATAPGPPRGAPPTPTQTGGFSPSPSVSGSTPSSVTSTVCSNCAESDPSAVTAVQRSSRISVFQ
jgi:acetylornithine/succinyldiaminopimelate/putrescine aminotransferase